MSEQREREKWNERYLQGSHGSLPPDPLLVSAFDRYIDPLFPEGGHALDMAGGTGRHAIFLAAKGWQVKMTDIAETGVARALESAGSLAGRIEFCVEDVTRIRESPATYDLITIFFFLRRDLFPALIDSLRPGGLLLFKAYTRRQASFAGGPTNPNFLLDENELLQSFPGLRILHYAELIRDCGMAELVARKA